MNIRLKLFTGAMGFITLLVFLGGSGFYFIDTTAKVSLSLVKMRALLLQLNEMDAGAERILLQVITHVSDQDPESMEQITQKVKESSIALEEQVNEYEGLVGKSEIFSDPQKKAQILEDTKSFLKLWAQFKGSYEKILSLSQEYSKEEAFALIAEEARPALENALAPFSASSEIYHQQTEILRKQVIQTREQSLAVIIIVTITISVLVAVGGLLFANSITNPLSRISKSLHQLGRKNLISELSKADLTRADELGQISRDYNTTINNLSHLIEMINGESETLSTASEELSATTTQIERTAEEFNQGIEQSTNAAIETTEIIKQQATAIESVNKRILQIESKTKVADTKAKAGTQTIEAAKQSIQKIADSSKQIENVMDVITDIANQINLLSLNAAIEAAKAGEAGKGFAVVADEVRNLADKSGDAVTKTRELIEYSSANINEGIHVIQKTGEVLSLIIQQVGEIAVQISEASERMGRQEHQIQEIANVAENIADVSKQNAVSTKEVFEAIKEIAVTTEELSTMAEHLQTQMLSFKTG